jgi:hypothetical protein
VLRISGHTSAIGFVFSSLCPVEARRCGRPPVIPAKAGIQYSQTKRAQLPAEGQQLALFFCPEIRAY